MALFEGLAEKLQETFKRLRGKGKLTETDVTEAMQEVRRALLAADVNFKVVKEFVNKVKERAVGAEVLESLTPGQTVVKIVYEELTALMGGEAAKLAVAQQPPTIIMMVGLQGAGKTTHAGKLALLLKKQGRRPLLAAADIYRPAAIKQLQVLGERIDVPVFTMGQQNPVDIARAAVEHAHKHNRDYLIIDTAGRLHIDETLMGELQQIKSTVNPHEILLVVDAMTGQDAVTVAEHFHTQLGIDGVILTKLDGDTRGGAALSVRSVTGRPIKFVGMGEKLEALEPFHPDRLAQRILGMGDVLTLIEKAQETIDARKAEEQFRKLEKNQFTLEDFKEQLAQMRKLGPLEQILGMLPGMDKMLKEKNVQVDEREFKRIEAIIDSMTVQERRRPELLNPSRRKRIAAGSGTSIADVNKLLKQFEQTRQMMKQFAGMGKKMKKGKFPKLPGMPFGPMKGR